ncbi:MAG: bifunctional pyr operon transcriptional regulator/uracil phosphoribosyltransferase PyrR [bacterium]
MVDTTYKFKVIITEDEIERALIRISSQIIEWAGGTEDLAIIGIYRGGAHLAKRVKNIIEEKGDIEIPIGTIDITLYRDDLSETLTMPEIHLTDINFDVNGKKIVLIDDVIYTGRTVRAAIDQIIDFGRPLSIALGVLIDRGHRELPIQPDFVGRKVPTYKDERIEVELREDGLKDQVVIGKKG